MFHCSHVPRSLPGDVSNMSELNDGKPCRLEWPSIHNIRDVYYTWWRNENEMSHDVLVSNAFIHQISVKVLTLCYRMDNSRQQLLHEDWLKARKDLIWSIPSLQVSLAVFQACTVSRWVFDQIDRESRGSDQFREHWTVRSSSATTHIILHDFESTHLGGEGLKLFIFNYFSLFDMLLLSNSTNLDSSRASDKYLSCQQVESHQRRFHSFWPDIQRDKWSFDDRLSRHRAYSPHIWTWEP